jgi:hypothetical protein
MDGGIRTDDEEHRGEAEPGGAGEPRAGEIAVIPYPRIRAQLGCGEEAGILLEDRRSVVKVYFAGMDRSYWVDRDRIEVIPAERLSLAPLIDLLHRVARLVGAVQIDFYDERDGVGMFHIFARGLDLDALLAVRDLLGPRLRHLRIDPGSIRKTRLTLAFTLSPADRRLP